MNERALKPSDESGARAFNLLDEPWIAVMRPDGQREKVSLTDVFARAGELCCLAGELPTQNVAMLRLLLAVLHVVIARYDEDGEEAQIESSKEGFDRWKHIWKERRFPTDTINKYLSKYRDRFWLFDPNRPFFQVPENETMGKATTCAADAINHEIAESNNPSTRRFFLQRIGTEKESLDYAEAARWLVCLMAYDTAVKPKGSKCFLATFTAVMADGDDLFETLMLNLVMGFTRFKPTFDERPAWEPEKAVTSQYNEIRPPDNLSALYTLQSRRVILIRKDDKVTGFREICGDVFQSNNAFVEQMTSWREDQKNKETFYPVLSRNARQLWRDFSALLVMDEPTRKCPEVVLWLNRLVREKVITKKQIRLRTVSSEYDAMGYCIKNTASDALTFSRGMLAEKGDPWIHTILEAISVADGLANQLGYFAEQIAKSTGDTKGSNEKEAAKTHAYFSFDIPFREWLESIDPERDEQTIMQQKWWDIAQKIIRHIGSELVRAASLQALVGRTATEKKGNGETKVTHSAPKAYNYFLWRTASLENLRVRGKKNG